MGEQLRPVRDAHRPCADRGPLPGEADGELVHAVEVDLVGGEVRGGGPADEGGVELIAPRNVTQPGMVVVPARTCERPQRIRHPLVCGSNVLAHDRLGRPAPRAGAVPVAGQRQPDEGIIGDRAREVGVDHGLRAADDRGRRGPPAFRAGPPVPHDVVEDGRQVSQLHELGRRARFVGCAAPGGCPQQRHREPREPVGLELDLVGVDLFGRRAAGVDQQVARHQLRCCEVVAEGFGPLGDRRHE